MRNTPLSREEIDIAQKMFEILPDEQKFRLLDLQDRIESCEGVDMAVEIQGGIPFEYWCDSCKKHYTRMYILLARWYQNQIIKIGGNAQKTPFKSNYPDYRQDEL